MTIVHPLVLALNLSTGRPQSIKIGNTPEEWVLCLSQGYVILKFTDDVSVIGNITGRDERAYRKEVANLVSGCEDKNLTLNMLQMKEIIVGMRKERRSD